MADPAEDRGDDLAPDASLATDIPDEAERRAEQMKYYGGEADDIDDEDFMSVDRGDSIEPPELDDEEEEEEQTAEAEGDETADADDDDDTDDEADTEDAVADDDESDAEAGDEGDVAESEADDDESKDTSGRDQRIPLSRFNEVNERMKAAERRLAELEKQEEAAEQAAEEAYDFDKAEVEYQELLLDGRTQEATAKRKEIRAAEHELWKNETKQETTQELSEKQSLDELNELSTQAAKMYPIFNDTAEEFDAAATQKVLTFMRGYAQEMNPADAFVSALSDVINMYDLDTKYGYTESQGETPKKQDATPKKKAPKKQTKEKLEVAKKQPKSPAGLGKGSADAGAAVPDIEKMSDAEIDALPADTLARLRGDYVD